MSRGVRYAHRSSSHIPIVTSIASHLDGRRENVSANVSHCHNTCPVIHQHTRYGWQRKNCENESTWTHITFPVVHATPRHAMPRRVTLRHTLGYVSRSRHDMPRHAAPHAHALHPRHPSRCPRSRHLSPPLCSPPSQQALPPSVPKCCKPRVTLPRASQGLPWLWQMLWQMRVQGPATRQVCPREAR